MKTYRPWAPHQAYLLPPAPQDWLPREHLAYFIVDLVGELDLSAIEDVLQARDPRGEKGYDPRMMVAVLLYAYSVGLFSSRRIARATYEDVAVRFISGDQHPHFTRIAAFRRDHLDALGALFVQTVQLCERAGLVNLDHVSIDGTKVRANASKHKAMSYDRMKKNEAKLEEEVAALLAKAEAIDAAEDEEFGANGNGLDIPEELKRRETRLARIRQAKAELEEEARQARARRLRQLADDNDKREVEAPTQKRRRAAKTRAAKQREQADELDKRGDDDEPPASPTLPIHQPPANTDGTPKSGAQRNFTDPDSKIMVEGSGAFAQAYNAQAAVTEEQQIIVACPLSNNAADAHYLVPTLAAVAQNTGHMPSKVTADNGYWSASNVADCEAIGVDAYISTGRKSRGPPSDCATSPRDEMAAKLQTPEGHEIYRRRKFTVEPVFGQIKEARGFRRFLLRGIERVQQEWALVCATHNLLKLFRAASAPA